MNAFTVPERLPTEEIACGSHVPILKALAAEFKPRRILELGSGLNSTPLFLDHTVFGSVEFVQSIENDESWFGIVNNAVSDDRFSYHLIEGEVAPIAGQLDIGAFDFIFCDDSRSAGERVATITAIAPFVHSDALCVIHDYEESDYQIASLAFSHQFFFDYLNPSVGVCWNGSTDHTRTLQRLRDSL